MRVFDIAVTFCAIIVLTFSFYMLFCASNHIAQVWGVVLIILVSVGMPYIYTH